ncbi:MAG: hypothetical protein IPI85_17210 [Dehalococcoidia bacterium]|nr:hypothetical protein [Dehalococcoidia bacterium]
MQLDWDKAINDILSEKMTCQACGAMGEQMIVGYPRSGRSRIRHALQGNAPTSRTVMRASSWWSANRARANIA